MQIIRNYRPDDETAVRHICFDTALYGESMAPVWNDPEFLTEALIGYYLHLEPEHLYVAEMDGEPAGYLAACLDHHRFEQQSARELTPRLLRMLARSGRWHNLQMWKALPRFATHGRRRRELLNVALPKYPAHLHINLAAPFRGTGLGDLLIAHLKELLVQAAIPGVHAVTTSEAGRRFFERQGFQRLGTSATPSLRDGSPVPLYLMGWVR